MKSFLQVFFFSFLSFLSSSAQTPPIKLGTLLCLTGPCAADGQAALNGATLAVDDLKAKSGPLFELVSEDSKEESGVGASVTAYQALKLKGIRMMLGTTWSSSAEPVATLAAKDRVLLISPSLGIEKFSKLGPTIFNAHGTDANNSRAMAKYIFEKGMKKVAVFASQQPWESEQGNAFKDEFEKLGGSITAYQEGLPTITDLKTEALGLVVSKPDAIFFGALIQMPLMAKELKKYKYIGPQFAAYIDATRIKEAEGALTGAKYMSPVSSNKDFDEKYKARFSGDPLLPAGIAYDVVMALAGIFEKDKNLDSAAVAKVLESIHHEGVYGNLAFNQDHVAVRDASLFEVGKDGVIAKVVEAEPDKNAEPAKADS